MRRSARSTIARATLATITVVCGGCWVVAGLEDRPVAGGGDSAEGGSNDDGSSGPSDASSDLTIADARSDVEAPPVCNDAGVTPKWQDSLLGYWPLDGTLADRSGHCLSLSMNTGAATYATGVRGQAIDLPGLRFLRRTVSEGLFPEFGTDDFTVLAWVRVTANAGLAPPIVQRYGMTGGHLFTWQPTNRLFVQAGTDSVFTSCTSATTLSQNAWHQIVFRRAGTALSFVIDAVAESCGGGLPSAFTLGGGSNADLTLGGGDFNAAFLIGQMDEVAIWRRALTDQEIADLHASGTPPGL